MDMVTLFLVSIVTFVTTEDSDIKIKSRRVDSSKLESIENTIKKQKAHDMKKFFGKSNIRRISILNNKCIT